MKYPTGLILAAAFLPAASAVSDGPVFEVASIKVAGPETRPPYKITGGPGTDDPGRFHASHMSTYGLLLRAFGVEIDQIRGPGWMTSMSQSYFNVDAIVPPHTTPEQFQKMFQNLLVERFHLVFRRDTHIFPGYKLVVDNGGPKIKPVDIADPNGEDPTSQLLMHSPKGDDGFPSAKGRFHVTISTLAVVRTKYQEWTMAEFVSGLGFLIASSQSMDPLAGKPRVMDMTRLPGKYTFVLEYYDPHGPPGLDPSGVPDVFSAVRTQLGLRLEKTAEVSLPVIIVESLDKTPTEN